MGLANHLCIYKVSDVIWSLNFDKECQGERELNSDVAFHSANVIKNHFLVFEVHTGKVTKVTSCVVCLFAFSWFFFKFVNWESKEESVVLLIAHLPSF